jgi:hypothetical protein
MITDNFIEDIEALDLEGYRLSFLAPTRGSVLPTVFDLERYFPGRLYWKWALMEKYTVDEPKLEELRAAGWEMIDHIAKPREVLHLTSQLGLVLALAHPGRLASPERGELVLWVRSQDLRRVEQCPVVLVYEAAQDAPMSELVRLIPGTHAITFEGEAVYRYEISQLGDPGLRLLQCIMAGTHYASDRGLPSEFRYALKPPKKSTQKKLQALQENMMMQFALAQAAAAQLSELYWQLHLQSVVKPVRPPHTLMDIPSAFRHANLYENGALIPATDGLEAVIRAMSDAHDDAKGWGGDRSKHPIYIHERATSTTAVTLRMNQLIPEDEHAVAKQLWERVTTYSDTDGDVLLAMLAQVVAAGPDTQGGTWITSSAILDYRGIVQKRHEVEPGVYRDAGHRPNDMRLIADCVVRLRDMHVSVRSYREPKKSGGRRRKVVQESYLVLISDFLTQAEEGQPKEDALQIAWYYRPGSCLDVPVRKNAKVAWLLQQALRYDPYHERWEKRLARYFMFQLRLNNSFGGTTIKRNIREILEESGLLSSINRTDPIRTKERFEKAMRTLTEHGHISDWGETPYLEAMKKRPARGWLEMWLDQELVIIAAPLIEDLARDMLDQIHTQQQRITAPKKQRRKKGDQQEEQNRQ